MALIISKAQFRAEQQKYIAIQNAAGAIHQKLPADSPERQFYVNAQEESFVFEKELVLDLLKQPFAQFLRVYYGAIPPGDNTLGKPHGSPTIILGAARRINPYTDIGDLYVEWPTGLDANGNEI
jgi:hypothetical protein